MEGGSGCRFPPGANLILVIFCDAELILLQVRMRNLRSRKALLIGINYDNEEELTFPQRDTKEMRRLLKGGV